MAKRIKIGNDIRIVWSIFTKDGNTDVPYNLEGKDLKLVLCSPYGDVPLADIVVSRNTISSTYLGKDQNENGSYTIALYENFGKPSMKCIDKVDAFVLVQHTFQTGGEEACSHIRVETVELQSDISTGPRGYSAYEVAVINGFIGTEEEWLASLVGPPGPPGVGTTYLDAYFNVVEGEEYEAMLAYDHGDVTKARLDEIIGEGGIPCLNVYINDAEEGEEPSWVLFAKAVYDGVPDSAYYAFRVGNSFVHDISIIFVDDEGLHGYGTIAYYQLLDLFSNALEPIEEVIPEEASSSNKLADKAYVDARVSIATDEEIHALFNA